MEFFTKHLRHVNESYIEHAKVATCLSFKLLVSSIAQAVHAVLPFVPPPCGTDVCSLIDYLEEKNPKVRSKCLDETDTW
jgi:hypothetical protein